MGDQEATEEKAEGFPNGLIKAFGMFCERSRVDWTSDQLLSARQQQGIDPGDFSGYKGVYHPHDGHRTIYAGLKTEQTLGRRLYQQTTNRREGR